MVENIIVSLYKLNENFYSDCNDYEKYYVLG